MSGTWVLGRPPATPGFVVYIMVDSVEATCAAVVSHGGRIVQPIGLMRPRSRRGSPTRRGTSSGCTSSRPKAER
ncbi:MAG TPA: hypothetical protein VES67_23300 [Vicinamibacterales bacterium]|nr:hypothetical protein [Vicinamibacterales bacterium]